MEKWSSYPIITDEGVDSKIIQGHVCFILMVHSRQAFHNRRRSFFLLRRHQTAAASLLQQQWMSKRTHRKFCTFTWNLCFSSLASRDYVPTSSNSGEDIKRHPHPAKFHNQINLTYSARGI